MRQCLSFSVVVLAVIWTGYDFSFMLQQRLSAAYVANPAKMLPVLAGWFAGLYLMIQVAMIYLSRLTQRYSQERVRAMWQARAKDLPLEALQSKCGAITQLTTWAAASSGEGVAIVMTGIWLWQVRPVVAVAYAAVVTAVVSLLLFVQRSSGPLAARYRRAEILRQLTWSLQRRQAVLKQPVDATICQRHWHETAELGVGTANNLLKVVPMAIVKLSGLVMLWWLATTGVPTGEALFAVGIWEVSTGNIQRTLDGYNLLCKHRYVLAQ